MALTINKGLDPLTKPRDVPRKRWAELVAARKYHCLGNIPTDCRTLLGLVADAEEFEWLGYGTRERYMREGLELDPVAVDLAIGFLRAAGTSVPIEFATAVDEGRKLRSHGTNQHTNGDSNRKSSAKALKGGTNSAYTIARLDRDAPELAARVRAGGISANAAAIEAGFRKKLTGIDRLRSAWKAATPSERRAFLKEVG